MKYRLLGSTGLRVSSLCLGTAFLGITPLEADVAPLLHRALDLGINFLDTANSYGNQARFDRPGVPPWTERPSSEEFVGRALRGRVRYDVIVATKVQEKVGEGPNDGGPTGGGLTRKHIMAQCEQSLRRLGTDYLDVYYAHHPDPTTPLDQTLRALDDLVRQGKVRYPALSNYPAWQLTHALWLSERLGLNPPVAMEMPYHVLNRGIEREVVPACLAFGVGITAYSPLGGGLLSGHYKPGQPPPPGSRASFRRQPGPAFPEHQLRAAAKLSALAAEWGHLPVQVALAWLLARPGLTSAIVGPETIQQLEELIPAADLTLTDEQTATLDELA
jgi:aryl-alcohol dehydrogenase-like predicted oxidoreductase